MSVLDSDTEGFRFTGPIQIGGEFRDLPTYGHLDVILPDWKYGVHYGSMILFRFQYLDGEFRFLELRPDHLRGIELIADVQSWLKDNWGNKITVEIKGVTNRLGGLLQQDGAKVICAALRAVAKTDLVKAAEDTPFRRSAVEELRDQLRESSED